MQRVSISVRSGQKMQLHQSLREERSFYQGNHHNFNSAILHEKYLSGTRVIVRWNEAGWRKIESGQGDAKCVETGELLDRDRSHIGTQVGGVGCFVAV
jgi:hypothetical protein